MWRNKAATMAAPRGSNWTADEDRRLLALIECGKSWVFISAALKRSVKSIQTHARSLNRESAKLISGIEGVGRRRRGHTTHSAPAPTLDNLLVELSNALTEYFRGPSGDREPLFDQRLAGAPVRKYGPSLLARMEAHYRI